MIPVMTEEDIACVLRNFQARMDREHHEEQEALQNTVPCKHRNCPDCHGSGKRPAPKHNVGGDGCGICNLAYAREKQR